MKNPVTRNTLLPTLAAGVAFGLGALLCAAPATASVHTSVAFRPGTLVTFTLDGNPLTTATVKSSGRLDFILPVNNGEDVVATGTRVDGQTDGIIFRAGDTTAPSAYCESTVDSVIVYSSPERQITAVAARGTVEYGSASSPASDTGNLVTRTVTIPFDDSKSNGAPITVTVTDMSGNQTVISCDTADFVAPPITAEIDQTSGARITGYTEPGATVQVFDHVGTPLGTGIVDANGYWYLDLPRPLTQGEKVEVHATDRAGNMNTTTATAPIIHIAQPTSDPEPTATPTSAPTTEPSAEPTASPSASPATQPTAEPPTSTAPSTSAATTAVPIPGGTTSAAPAQPAASALAQTGTDVATIGAGALGLLAAGLLLIGARSRRTARH